MNRQNKTSLTAFCIFVATLATSMSAHAETIYLTCTGGGAGPGVDGVHTVDVTNNTVDGLPATVTATTISWTIKIGSNIPGVDGDEYYSIDRTAGTLSQREVRHVYGNTQIFGPNTASCVAGGPPKTKF
jgi:hypothetical protein